MIPSCAIDILSLHMLMTSFKMEELQVCTTFLDDITANCASNYNLLYIE